VTATASEILVFAYAAPHCTEHDCRKCAARARWNRRKGRRHSRKNPTHRRIVRK
jgi:hypothetical protein